MYNRINFRLIIILSLIITIAACKKNSDGSSNSSVYVTGNAYSPDTVVLWKNGKQSNFSIGQSTGIAFSGNDLYLSGIAFMNDTGYAAYWKNGQVNMLAANGRANSVFSYNNDIYISGLANGNAMYWKNGIPVTIGNDSSMSEANSVFVSGGDVYACGYQTSVVPGFQEAVYWKNGAESKLINDGSTSLASDIFVSGNDVYICGAAISTTNSNNIPFLYKNGTITYLSDITHNCFAYSVYVNGADVYVTGNIDNAAVYWKNGDVHYLQGGTPSFAAKMYISNGDVYIAGEVFNNNIYTAGYWKNGNLNQLGNNSISSFASAVIVK